MDKKLIFIVDQDAKYRDLIASWLKPNYQVMVFDEGEACLHMLDHNPDAICMDLMSPGIEGINTLKRINLVNRDIPVIVASGNNDLDLAVQAMKIGAFDYMVKPVDKIRLCANIEKAIETHSLIDQIGRLKGEAKQPYTYKNLVGQSEGMKQTFSQIENIMNINVNVFINGESGTGKELVARAIHYNSPFRDGNFVDINCGAIPEELQESEFFGHEKGAFTGADSARKGKLEMADGGTLFLDELAELSPKAQVKLLRFLQEKTFERVGGNKKIHVDLRIISATNKNIEHAVATGKFREDLFYRLVVYPIYLPPLRDRKDDISLLAGHFLKKYKNDVPQNVTAIDPGALAALTQYSWPGNVRQLENVIFRAMISARSGAILPNNLPEEIVRFTPREPKPLNPEDALNAQLPLSSGSSIESFNPPPTQSITDIEKQAIFNALEQSGGNIPQAAKSLGISRATFYRKIKKYRAT